MGRSLTETLMGAVVLIVAISFATFAYQSSSIQTNDLYSLTARFDNVDGVGVGDDIRIGGIKVGVVQAMDLDPQTYMAVLTLGIRNDVPVPADSTAAIVSESLLGSKYIALDPGGDDMMLKDGESISITQSSVNLETLIGKFMFSGDGKSSGGEEESPAADDTAAPGI